MCYFQNNHMRNMFIRSLFSLLLAMSLAVSALVDDCFDKHDMCKVTPLIDFFGSSYLLFIYLSLLFVMLIHCFS